MSCNANRSELWFDEDGSGKIEILFDMGPGIEMMQQITESLDSLAQGRENTKVDMWEDDLYNNSSLSILDMIPDSIAQQMTNPELLSNVWIENLSDKEKKIAQFAVSIFYQSPEHLDQVFDAFHDVMKKSVNKYSGQHPLEKDYFHLFKNFNADIENGIITIKGMDMSKADRDPMMEQMLEQLRNDEGADSPEFLKFMKMMFGDEKETIVHAPGDILFTSDMDAVIDGNTVIFKDDILEVLKSGVSNDRIIRFEK